MRVLDMEDQVDQLYAELTPQKVIKEGQYFKIQHTYFKVSGINPKGIEAKGVSRREYFDNR